MSASSSTVLANLAYLIGAVVVAVVAAVVIWLRHRQPKSVDANMASFRRGLSALAPDDAAAGPSRQTDQARIRPIPVGLTHVRLESSPGNGASPEPRPEPVSEEDNGDFGSGRSG